MSATIDLLKKKNPAEFEYGKKLTTHRDNSLSSDRQFINFHSDTKEMILL